MRNASDELKEELHAGGLQEAEEKSQLTPEALLSILARAGLLKKHTRHCWIEEDRKESVADHSWRIALMAMLLDGVPEFREADLSKVIRMCLIHDLGEAFTGDIPTFEKTEDQAETEDQLFFAWVEGFPEPVKTEWKELLAEMLALETPEARIYKALDKVEALISHNESDLSTWLPLERELQLIYGAENVKFSPYLTALRAAIDEVTLKKLRDES